MIRPLLIMTLVGLTYWTGPGHADPLAGLIAEREAFELAEDPILASRYGDMQAAGRLPVVTLERTKHRDARNQEFLERIQAIDSKTLDQQGRLNRDLLIWILGHRVRRAPFDEARAPFISFGGFHATLLELAYGTAMRSEADGEAWIARLADGRRYLGENADNMRRGIETGWTQPPVVTELTIGQVTRLIRAGADNSPLLAPLNKLPVSDQRRGELIARGVQVIENSLLPAYRDLLAFLEEDYLPAARSQIGARALPGGEDYYPAMVRFYTSLDDVTPDQIHQLGVSEVARIRGEMQAIIEELGFEGSFQDFLTFLRTDPQFYVTSADDLLKENAWVAKRVDAKMPEFFATLPRLPYGVRPMADAIATGGLTGFYENGNPELGVAGAYVVNTTALDSRPLYELPSLAMHEGVPGHHHQTALAQELDNLPAFRRRLYINAFGEGWALYTEYLGHEMGIYRTPYERFGQLSYEMWRACRLVADTGIHWMGWSRQQAERCFLENSALTKVNIEAEVTRYISYPGQALAYKMGELKIKELRARAERALGSRFDIRTFHDAILLDGTLPLTLLETKIERWLQARLAIIN